MMKILLSLALLSVSLPVYADEGGAGEGWCWDVKGSLTAQFTASDCTSAIGLCTAGVIEAQGFLTGTTNYTAHGLGGEMMGEASIVTPPVEPGSTWSYAGELVIATAFGTLTLTDVGVLDTARGLFSEFDRVVGGTGLYEGATGTLFIFGYTFPDGSGFDGDVRGELCLPTEPSPARHRHSRSAARR